MQKQTEIRMTKSMIDDIMEGKEVDINGVTIKPPYNEIKATLIFSVPITENIKDAMAAIESNIDDGLGNCPYGYTIDVQQVE